MVIARDPPAHRDVRADGRPARALHAVCGRESLPAVAEDPDVFDILPAAELSLDQMDARPGNVLVLVRNPHSLAHVAAALQTPRDRDVVVMTVRLLGVDVSADGVERRRTDACRAAACSRKSSALAERLDRPVRLLVVPAHDVFAAIVGDDPAPALVRRARRRVVHALGRRTGAASRRRLGEGAPRPSRSTSGWSSIIAAAAPTPITSAPIRRRSLPAISISSIASGWTRPRPSARTSIITTSSGQRSRKWNSNSTDHSATRRSRPSARRARRADELTPVLRARDYAQLRDMHAQPPRQRRGDAPDRAQHRGSGRRVPRPAAQGRRRGVRVPVAGGQGNAAQGDGAGRRRRAAQQHGARRSHHVPRRAAGDRDARTADAADAGRARPSRWRCSAIRSARSAV